MPRWEVVEEPKLEEHNDTKLTTMTYSKKNAHNPSLVSESTQFVVGLVCVDISMTRGQVQSHTSVSGAQAIGST